MLVDETISFLHRVPPFSLLPGSELESMIGAISLDYFPRGALLLEQGAEPTENLFVIKRGGVRVFMRQDEGEPLVIDYRTEGDYFGLLSLVSGDAPRASIEAIDDTIAYLVPRQPLLDAFSRNPSVSASLLKSYFTHFIDKTFEEARKREGGFGGADGANLSIPVAEIIRRPPVTALSGVSIQEAANRMAGEKVSSLIVIDVEEVPLGIVTDRDLREKVVARGRDVSTTVDSIMSSPLIGIDSAELCFEALLRMVRDNIHHLLVTEEGKPKGVITNHDLMILQGTSPTMLVKRVTNLQDLDHLNDMGPRLHQTVASLMRQGARAHNVTSFITELIERVLNRAVDLVEEKVGDPPIPYSLFVQGQAGRRALTLGRQVKLGAIFRDDTDDAQSAALKQHLCDVMQHLHVLVPGCAPVEGESCLQQTRIRSLADWTASVETWDGVTRDHLVEPGLFEMRAVRGDRSLTDQVRERLVERARTDRSFLEALVADTVSVQPPLGFFKRFVVERSGEHRNELSLYEKGISPLVEGVRMLALMYRVEEFSTRGRLRALKTEHSVAEADEIEQALHYLHNLLVLHQLKQVESGAAPDDFVDPETLAAIDRKSLKDSFRLVGTVYDLIRKGVKDLPAKA